ncbi:MAG: hypothetical protein MZV64_13385 [Ignavibacteriales bacterium]|nr:hypothetical protein [Ignavibacteriales bacterium]
MTPGRRAIRESVSLRTRHNLGPAPSLLAGTIRVRGLEQALVRLFVPGPPGRQARGFHVLGGASATSCPDVARRRGLRHPVPARREGRPSSWFGLTWSYKIAGSTSASASPSTSRSAPTGPALQESRRGAGPRPARSPWPSGPGSIPVHALPDRCGRSDWPADFKDVTLGLTLTTAQPGRRRHRIDRRQFHRGRARHGRRRRRRTITWPPTTSDRLNPPYFRTPFSLAAGMTVKIQKVRVYWQRGVVRPRSRPTPSSTPCRIRRPERPARSCRPTSPTSSRPSSTSGFGLEWFYSSRFKGYASFTTDYLGQEHRARRRTSR